MKDLATSQVFLIVNKSKGTADLLRRAHNLIVLLKKEQIKGAQYDYLSPLY